MPVTIRRPALVAGILCCFLAAGLRAAPPAPGAVPADWVDRVEAAPDMDTLGRLYLELLLEEDPGNAATFGVHGRGDDSAYYDRKLADPSRAAEQAFISARDSLIARLQAFDAGGLSRPEQIDRHILLNQVKLDRLVIDRLESGTNPLNAVTSLGGAMAGLVLRDYAPLEERLRSFGSRCEATPRFFAAVRTRLAPDAVLPTGPEKAVTRQRLEGMQQPGGLYDKTLPDLLESSALKPAERQAIESACAAAVESIGNFAEWFEATIVPRTDSDWRLGRDLYDEKYALQMDYPLDAENLLAVALGWLAVKGDELVAIGRELHDDYLAESIAAGEIQPQASLDDAEVVRNVFAKLSKDRPSPESLIPDSYALADSIIGFVREQDLMDLPPASKLRIEPTPPHLAGNAVAQITTAPPFEPELESVWFWDIGLLSESPGFLKEYNRPALAMVYIHEGVPGHFVQLEYSNRADRLIPKVFWNGPMVEGWASYIATQLVEQGFTVYPDHPLGHALQRMVDTKLTLRAVINAIIDIRLHRTHWPEEEAVKLMTEKGFQEEGEARGKLLRAKLSSVQLATYFAGQVAIEDILREYRERAGSNFSWKAFNQRLVGAGSPPFFAIREFMLGDLVEEDDPQ
ncbi:DUF885 domain-containing protein [Elongatibacter sediminis]|uniref:DUF885 domain-containing protein n=1 Tax=Elongatibacter sediminis TaxID=3119006 RepID=A0AAW9RA85_9GAMM